MLYFFCVSDSIQTNTCPCMYASCVKSTNCCNVMHLFWTVSFVLAVTYVCFAIIFMYLFAPSIFHTFQHMLTMQTSSFSRVDIQHSLRCIELGSSSFACLFISYQTLNFVSKRSELCWMLSADSSKNIVHIAVLHVVYMYKLHVPWNW